MKAGTNLEKVLESGKFAVTAEITPPKGVSTRMVEKLAAAIRNSVDAVNIADNQSAIVRMSSIAGCVIMKQTGADPIFQMTCRDRNRIAIQSDVLGAVALGIGNILCLSGDHQTLGNHPGAKGVFDIDSIQLIQALKAMRDERKFICGDDISGEVPIFIGAVENPFADPPEFRIQRLTKKVKAGTDFIQTQAIFDIDRFAAWMKEAEARGLDTQTHILAGVTPLRSADMARHIQDHVPGSRVPDEFIRRMGDAADSQAEGAMIAIETIEQLKKIPGVHGIHIMPMDWEEIVPMVVERAGLLPRPSLS
ncbi:MAG: methylenetetrahydrofolate reductase [Dehalococcoidia bacterium]|nr:methylenetetrahydrofolate reductase [Dehalococcoidia bacterium]